MPIFTVTLAEIVDEVIGTRFNESQRDFVEKWAIQAYKKVWHAADWPWKFAETDLAVTASSNTPSFSDLSYAWESSEDTPGPGRILNVYDDDGAELQYLTMREWNRLYKGDETNTGTPAAWTTVRSSPTSGSDTAFVSLSWPTIKLGPTPSSSATYSAYVELGPTVPELDVTTPILPADFTYACVYGAMAIGLRLENDPTWDEMEKMFREEISLMLNAHLPETLAPNRSYGGPDNFIYGR